MIAGWIVLLVALFYLSMLFAVAWWGERRSIEGRSLVNNPYSYALSLAVFCTAWTFYGSVGRAATGGLAFLPIYIGPTLMMPIMGIVYRKMIRLSKAYRLTSIADFLASRYGKSASLGGLVTLIAVLGGVPYVALQLKAISTSFVTLSGSYSDTSFLIALGLGLFAILFGTRHLNPLERHEGMVAAVVFESVVKLVTFLILGVFVTWGMFDGMGSLFQRAMQVPELSRLMTLQPEQYTDLMWTTLLSGLAVVLLPRQFHMAVVENTNEAQLNKAIWLFPLYLLLINIFVIPVAFGGRLMFGSTAHADSFVLALPIAAGKPLIALMTFIGGFSAATGMVIVATIALSTMICNDLVVPALLTRFQSSETLRLPRLLLVIRRLAILFILGLGYLYFKVMPTTFSLVNIGLISFASIAQFAPAFFGGLFWKRATQKGAFAGMISGFVMWTITLLIPSLTESGLVSSSIVTYGYFGISWLKPYALFGLSDYGTLSHALFWSLITNISLFVGVSLFTKQSVLEKRQAIAFVEGVKAGEKIRVWTGEATYEDLLGLLRRFFGKKRAETMLNGFRTRHAVLFRDEPARAMAELVQFTEMQLVGVIGSASARVMVASVVKERPVDMEELMHMLDETRQVIQYSRQLEEKSQALERASKELREANERLQELDSLKDDFISTVTHELRTPLTSIRALSEIMQQNDALPEEQRKTFLDIIIRESERLGRLINDVLDLEKVESNKMDWNLITFNAEDIIKNAIESTEPLAAGKRIQLDFRLPALPILVTADPDRLHQVMVNLISNAIKFCPEDTGRIRIRLQKKGDKVRVDVVDNGIGIAPESLEVIFDKFHQVDNLGRGKPAGSGLGLAICRRIVEAHQGKIWAKSTVGKGSMFSFVIAQHTYPDHSDASAASSAGLIRQLRDKLTHVR